MCFSMFAPAEEDGDFMDEMGVQDDEILMCHLGTQANPIVVWAQLHRLTEALERPGFKVISIPDL